MRTTAHLNIELEATRSSAQPGQLLAIIFYLRFAAEVCTTKCTLGSTRAQTCLNKPCVPELDATSNQLFFASRTLTCLMQLDASTGTWALHQGTHDPHQVPPKVGVTCFLLAASWPPFGDQFCCQDKREAPICNTWSSWTTFTSF